MGDTWGDYVKMLHGIADSLGQTGQTYSVSELFAVAVQWANDGFSPFGRLVTNTDLAAGALSFNRIFIGKEISSRYYEGDLGFGWDHNWNWNLDIKTNGDVALQGLFGVERLFQGDSRSLGDFVSQPGDGGTLRLTSMKYTFTESNGMVLTFNSQEQLEKVPDPNGNTVTVTYTSGKLTTLADEFGNSLIITYNANGKIESVTDNLGNATTYTYDTSGKNLVKVTNVQYGLSVDYVYNDYKLSEINYADGNSQHFIYADGILVETYIDGMTSTKYVGGNTAKDLLKYEVYEGTTHVQTIWFNTSGQIAKAVDAQGRMVIYEYDDFGRVTKITDEKGSFSSMEYDHDGNLVYSRNTNGEELRYVYSADGKLETLTDSKGNVTTFHYDEGSNLMGIERADGTSSDLTYNANGTVATATNRRGDTYTYTYDSTGKLIENKPSTADNPILYEYVLWSILIDIFHSLCYPSATLLISCVFRSFVLEP